jgi:hypothetical protein
MGDSDVSAIKEIDERERVGTKLIIYDIPSFNTAGQSLPPKEWVSLIARLNFDLVLVDAAGVGGFILRELQAQGVNAAALPKIGR